MKIVKHPAVNKARGDDKDQRREFLRANPLQQLITVHDGHLQVADNEIDPLPALAENCVGLLPVRRL